MVLFLNKALCMDFLIKEFPGGFAPRIIYCNGTDLTEE